MKGGANGTMGYNATWPTHTTKKGRLNETSFSAFIQKKFKVLVGPNYYLYQF